jgi:hypothetical protein
MSGTELRDAPQGISGLHSLLGGDARKLQLVSRSLYRSILMDLQRMEQAAEQGDWQSVCMLARRISIDCEQVSEHRAEFAICSLARLRDARSMRNEYRLYRDDLARLAEHAKAVAEHYPVAFD